MKRINGKDVTVILAACLVLIAPMLAGAEGADAVFVLGGTRGTGLEVVRQLQEQGRPVTALVRETSNLDALKTTNAKLATGDALDKDSIDAAIAEGSFTAVISTLGGTEAGGYQVDSVGNINGMKAAEEAGITRFILISSIGVGDSEAALPPPVIKALSAVFEQKGRAEAYLAGSELDYTILRPGGLTNKPASGKGVLIEDPMAGGVVSRAELARLTVASLDDEETLRKTFAAVER
jgi:uncharacterized protein YbjT (DUF2867 family)